MGPAAPFLFVLLFAQWKVALCSAGPSTWPSTCISHHLVRDAGRSLWHAHLRCCTQIHLVEGTTCKFTYPCGGVLLSSSIRSSLRHALWCSDPSFVFGRGGFVPFLEGTSPCIVRVEDVARRGDASPVSPQISDRRPHLLPPLVGAFGMGTSRPSNNLSMHSSTAILALPSGPPALGSTPPPPVRPASFRFVSVRLEPGRSQVP